jgi:hypothetical protein
MKQEKNFTTSIVVDKSPAEAFNAINNVRSWWQGAIAGNTEKLNDEFTYTMEPYHVSKQKVVELIPGKKIAWLVTESKINFVADKNEWLNTKIIFDINTVNNKTNITFTHQGLIPAIECYGGCSDAWEKLIEQSLYSFINTGKGVDVF